jgi:hypothetical protein
MITEIISWIAVILILLAASGLLLSRDWRWSMGLLAVIYLSAFWMVARHWPVGMAAVKLVTGWMVTAALGMTRLGITKDESTVESFWPRGLWFRVFLAGIVILLTAAAVPRIEAIIPGLGLQVVAGGLLLIGLGLIHLGITGQILRVILGLLTMLAGFEIIYAAVESSILVAGMLAVVNLGLALAGSYLMMANSSTEEAV